MIARTWWGATRADDAADYLEYLRETGLSEYARIPGHRRVEREARDALERTRARPHDDAAADCDDGERAAIEDRAAAQGVTVERRGGHGREYRRAEASPAAVAATRG